MIDSLGRFSTTPWSPLPRYPQQDLALEVAPLKSDTAQPPSRSDPITPDSRELCNRAGIAGGGPSAAGCERSASGGASAKPELATAPSQSSNAARRKRQAGQILVPAPPPAPRQPRDQPKGRPARRLLQGDELGETCLLRLPAAAGGEQQVNGRRTRSEDVSGKSGMYQDDSASSASLRLPEATLGPAGIENRALGGPSARPIRIA